MSRRALATVALLCGGCALDFSQFLVGASDGGLDVPRDATDARPPRDEGAEGPPPRDIVDVTSADRLVCAPGRATETRIRVAHMAPDIGPIDLCMRRRGTTSEPMMRVLAAQWPADGLEYTNVSQSVPLNTTVTRSNEAWDFAVVPRGMPCSQVTTSTGGLAQRSLQFDPGTLRLLLITSERVADGSAVPVLSLLPDEDCTDCTQGQVDVRGVHASLGGAAHRLNFALEPQVDPRVVPVDLASMRTFSSSVAYGGDVGYACNALWSAIATSRLGGTAIPVQLTVTTAAGRLLARSDPARLKVALLAQSRTATVFFEGDYNAEASPPVGDVGFVICYDGTPPARLSACDRIVAHLVDPDAGVDGGVDASADGATTTDASVTDVIPADVGVTDVAVVDAADAASADDVTDAAWDDVAVMAETGADAVDDGGDDVSGAGP